LTVIEGTKGPVRKEIESILDDLADVLRGAVVVGEVTARTRDRIAATGEKLSVRMIAHILRSRGRKAVAMDADTFIDTDDSYSDADPVPLCHRSQHRQHDHAASGARRDRGGGRASWAALRTARPPRSAAAARIIPPR